MADLRSSPRSNFLPFLTVSGTMWPNKRLVPHLLGWYPPWEIPDPSLHWFYRLDKILLFSCLFHSKIWILLQVKISKHSGHNFQGITKISVVMENRHITLHHFKNISGRPICRSKSTNGKTDVIQSQRDRGTWYIRPSGQGERSFWNGRWGWLQHRSTFLRRG